MIRLFIVDDHPLMRDGLRQLFASQDDIKVVGEAANYAEIFTNLQPECVDLLLLDLCLPDIAERELVATVRARLSDLPILVLSMHNDVRIVQHALKAGANGYVTKGGLTENMLEAIRKVAAGGRFIDSAIAEAMVFEAVPAYAEPHHDCLSRRELQIMGMLAGGIGINEIADRLLISNKTVSTYKSRLMEKMGFVSTADLVRYAVQKGIAE
jgi:DNA-binding NarL/FixJ family response regulator